MSILLIYWCAYWDRMRGHDNSPQRKNFKTLEAFLMGMGYMLAIGVEPHTWLSALFAVSVAVGASSGYGWSYARAIFKDSPYLYAGEKLDWWLKHFKFLHERPYPALALRGALYGLLPALVSLLFGFNVGVLFLPIMVFCFPFCLWLSIKIGKHLQVDGYTTWAISEMVRGAVVCSLCLVVSAYT